MVGWLYIDDNVAAPIRVLEIDERTGLISIEIAAKFVPNRADLRGSTVVEHRGWKRRRQVRCLGAEQIGSELMIEAVDVGTAEPEEAADPRGVAEDWLIVNGNACCRVNGLRIGSSPGSLAQHCLFRVPLSDWRDLRIGEEAALASVGVRPSEVDACDGSITPLLHAARDRGPGDPEPTVDIVRLRERLRYRVGPLATDWGDDCTLVVCRVHGVGELTPSDKPAETEPAERPHAERV
ncbi:MAG: hypothetical protein ACE37H_02400 [Phycisphaeraceae bacterium]